MSCHYCVKIRGNLVALSIKQMFKWNIFSYFSIEENVEGIEKNAHFIKEM